MCNVRSIQTFFIRSLSFLFLLLLWNGIGETAVFAAANEAIPVACINGLGHPSALINAIEQANIQPGPDIIELGSNCSYRLFNAYESGSGLPLIEDHVTIEGNGATIYRRPRIGSAAQFRLLAFGSPFVNGGINITLRNLHLYNGDTKGAGGAFLAQTHRFEDSNGNGGTSYINLTLENVVVRNNKAGTDGGAIHVVSPGIVDISDSTFEDNHAPNGGAIHWHGYEGLGRLIIRDNTSFSENEAEKGAGLYVELGGVTLNDAEFSDNIATKDGGGLYFRDGGKLTIEDSTFIRNKAAKQGGGLFANRAAELVNTHFRENEAEQQGGGIAALNELQVSGGSFEDNWAGASGGGIYKSGVASFAIDGVQFDENKSGSYGGALLTETTLSATIRQSHFRENETAVSGAAIHHLGYLTLEESIFEANSSPMAGGIYLRVENLHEATIHNNLWLRNQSAEDILAHISNGNPVIQIVYNTHIGLDSANDETAIHLMGAIPNFFITNNIIAHYDTAIDDGQYAATLYNNLYFDNETNEVVVGSSSNAIIANPRFVEPDDDDYRLQDDSPAIDAGSTAVSGTILRDLVGNARPQGNGFDIGAYESS